MTGHPVDPATGRAVLGGRAKRPRRYVLVQARGGGMSHLLDIDAPAAQSRTLCRMLRADVVEPGTRRDECKVCRRVHDRITQGGAR